MTAPVRTAAPSAPAAVARGDRWRDDRAGLVAFVVLAALFATTSFLRWSNHWAGALDLGLFDQGVWLLSEGRAPELTVLPENLFGDHFSPVLVLFAPLYLVRPSPGWLLAVQALAVAATVLPMRALARDLGVRPAWATAAVAASSPLWMMVLYDFHPVALTAPLVTAALVAARRDQARTALALTIAVGLVRADSAVLILGVAVVATPRVRRVIVPAALASMAVGVAVPMLLHTEQTFARYYGGLGDSPLDAATHPWRVVTTLLGSQARSTLLLWLVPVGFLPLLRPRWFAALVVGGLPILLSSKVNTSLPWFHHAGTVAPLAIAAALAGLARAQEHLGSTHRLAHPDPSAGSVQVHDTGGSAMSEPPTGPSATPGGEAPARTLGALVVHAVLPLGLVTALVTQGPLTPDGPSSQTVEALRPRNVAGLAAALDAVEPADRVAAESWIVVELARRPVVHPLFCDLEPDCALPGAPGESIDVVVADSRHAERLEAMGWRVDAVRGGDLVVARPGEGP